MSTEVLCHPGPFRPVLQFSIHADNKVGRLNELVGLISEHTVHIMALSILDTTDRQWYGCSGLSTRAEKLLTQYQFPLFKVN